MEKEITNLENKPDKTSEEEEELGDLKKKLKDLDKKENNSPPTSYLPWIIGGSCLIVVLVLVAFILTRQKRKRTH